MLASYYLANSDNFASLSRKFGSGHHQKYNRDNVIAAIKEIRFQKRTMYCKLASALNLPKSTVYSIAKDIRHLVGRDTTSYKCCCFEVDRRMVLLVPQKCKESWLKLSMHWQSYLTWWILLTFDMYLMQFYAATVYQRITLDYWEHQPNIQ